MQALLNPNLTSDCLHLGCGLTAPNDWLNVDGSLQVVFARRPRLKRALVRLGVYPRSQAAIPWPTYDANSLNKLLIDAGFSDVTNPPCQQGRLPRLLQIEAPIRVEAGVGVIAEGIKP